MRLPSRAPAWDDVALASLLAAAGTIQVVVTDQHWPEALWTLAITLPLAVRRQAPAVVATGLATIGLAHALATTAAPPFGATVLAVIVAFYTAGAWADQRWAAVALGLCLAAFWTQDALARHRPSEYFASLTLVAGPWLAGQAVRRVRWQNTRLASLLAALKAEREGRERDAVLAERARIARDLHDVIGHSLSVISLQAQAADAALEADPARVRAPVVAIAAATKTAMIEMRRLVDVLGVNEDAHVGLDELPALADEHRAAGLAVDLRVAAEQVPAGVQVTAYRIVQEALTNVRRHSQAGCARVEVVSVNHVVRVEVTDPGPVAPAISGGGRGLVGVRTRAASCAGSVEAGPDGDGWRLRACLPFAGARR